MTMTAQHGLAAELVVSRDGFTLDVSLKAQRGILVVFGPSGSGKSTLLQAIAGLIAPRSGEISLAGKTLLLHAQKGPYVDVPARARRIGYVFQDLALFPHLTALGNVMYPLWRQPNARQRALGLLERAGLADFADRRPHQLSGGQQQRVAIARALAVEPDLLLLDEPFAALDADLRRTLRAELRRLLADWGIPIILVTHDREDALALGDDMLVLDQGRVVARGAPVQVLGQPPTALVARLVGVENLYRARVLQTLPQEGVMLCDVQGVTLEAPLADVAVGAAVTLGLRARDVLLAVQEPVGLSARNVLPGRIADLDAGGPGISVAVDCGGLLMRSQVTPEAVNQLGLHAGRDIWVIVKASSFFLVASAVEN